MWIENTRNTSRHYNAELLGDLVDDPVEDLPGDERGIVYNDTGTVQVTDAVGEALVEHYDAIQPYEAEATDESES